MICRLKSKKNIVIFEFLKNKKSRTVILVDNCFVFFIYERKNFGGVYGTENNIWIY